MREIRSKKSAENGRAGSARFIFCKSYPNYNYKSYCAVCQPNMSFFACSYGQNEQPVYNSEPVYNAQPVQPVSSVNPTPWIVLNILMIVLGCC
mgnify:CR=1 FL=1